MNTHKQIVLIVALSFLFVGACAAYSAIDLPLRSPRQSAYFQSESIDRGALLFANNCRTCHGIKGQGGVGLPLNKPDFKNQDPLILVANQALIHTTLFCGRAGTLMPPWLNTNGGSLNTEQIQHLIDLREALRLAYVAAWLTPPTYTDLSLAVGTAVIVADIAELRAAVDAIE